MSQKLKYQIIVSAIVSMTLVSCKTKVKTVKLSYAQVVERLTDLKFLALLPEAGEQSAMWSSYDRESKIDSSTDEFINWDANIDGLEPQFIRKEGDNEVLAEMTGPGAIVRIWSASPRKGKVKIYIDGSEEPILNESFIDYFKPSIPAFDFSELVYETNAKGFNNYVPITYQKSCKIVAEPGWGQYYHFNYISFPEGTEVEPFEPDLNEGGKKALAKVNDFFKNDMGNNPDDESDFNQKQLDLNLKAGETKTVLSIEGEGAISTLKAKFKDVDSIMLEEIMRKTVLEIRWDGQEKPAVWSPLGDFFGTSPGWNNYRTLPMGMTRDWAYSHWYMPYSDGAEIILHNFNDTEVSVALNLSLDTLEQDAEDYGRFYAKWHRDLEPLEESRWPDWTLLKTEGKGRFVGAHLLVWNPKGGSADAGGPGHYWWGEGDEKFFVDGEKFPSTFGTGTEDYFGYAWCDPSVFERAFHSQTQDNDNMGYQPMNRWQISDNVPFQKSFDGYLEKYFPNDLPTQYCTVVYWYLSPDGKDNLEAVPPEALYGYETQFEVFRKEGVVEGENLKIETNSGGWVTTEFWAHESLYESVSGHKGLNWFAAKDKPNELLTSFNFDKDGYFEVYANIIKYDDGGKFEMSIDGEELGALDFQAPKKQRETQRISLGKINLKPGRHNLKLKWSGKDKFPEAARIDYLEFVEL